MERRGCLTCWLGGGFSANLRGGNLEPVDPVKVSIQGEQGQSMLQA